LIKEHIDKLKYVLASEDTVSIDRWKEFIQWFTPLVMPEFYQTTNKKISMTSSLDSHFGYQIEDIVDIVGAPWFFGFMTAGEARDVLLTRPIGSFLFRFSSSPSCYTLSVNYGQIGHWRITTEKVGTSYPTFKIDGRDYTSMYEIVDKHLEGREPLPIKVSNVNTLCYLKDPVIRFEKHEITSTQYEGMF